MEKEIIQSVYPDGNNITISSWDQSSKILISTVSSTGKIISNVFINKEKAIEMMDSLTRIIEE